MSNTTDSAPKKQRGRPSGSFSFVSVRMSDLTQKVGPTGNVTVSAKFAQDLGIEAVSIKASSIHKRSFAGEGGTVEVRSVTPAV